MYRFIKALNVLLIILAFFVGLDEGVCNASCLQSRDENPTILDETLKDGSYVPIGVKLIKKWKFKNNCDRDIKISMEIDEIDTLNRLLIVLPKNQIKYLN